MLAVWVQGVIEDLQEKGRQCHPKGADIVPASADAGPSSALDRNIYMCNFINMIIVYRCPFVQYTGGTMLQCMHTCTHR